MFLGIRLVQEQKSLFSVDKPVLDTAQEPRASPQKIAVFGKRTHSEKTGISLVLQSGQKEWKHATKWGRRHEGPVNVLRKIEFKRCVCV